METVVNQIVEKHKSLFGEKPVIAKINAGFTNTIFSVGDNCVLKICHDEKNEKEFAQEIKFYLANKDKPYMLNKNPSCRIAKCLKSGFLRRS